MCVTSPLDTNCLNERTQQWCDTTHAEVVLIKGRESVVERHDTHLRYDDSRPITFRNRMISDQIVTSNIPRIESRIIGWLDYTFFVGRQTILKDPIAICSCDFGSIISCHIICRGKKEKMSSWTFSNLIIPEDDVVKPCDGDGDDDSFELVKNRYVRKSEKGIECP